MENKKNIFSECRCGYCLRWGWPLLRHIKKLKLNWFEIPKNGTVSIKWANRNRGHIKNRTKPDTKILIVWRDPVDRFKSIIKHYFVEKGGRYQFGVDFLSRLDKDITSMSIEQIVDFVLDNLDKLSTKDEVHHFYPQVRFIDYEHYHNFEFVDMKDITKRFQTNFLNKSKAIDINFTDKQISKIKEIYSEDYEFYNNYVKESHE